MCESFFATLECELLNRRGFKSQVEARMAIFDFIEGWRNPSPFGARLSLAHQLRKEPFSRSCFPQPNTANRIGVTPVVDLIDETGKQFDDVGEGPVIAQIGEWRRGIAPLRSRRTGREPLDSSGSHHLTAGSRPQ